MAKSFKELRDKMSPESRRKSEALANRYRSEMALDDLRRARQLTQESLARTLNVNQAAISKMERRADMYLSTLRAIIEAMGGELVLQAVFPDRTTELDLRPRRKTDAVRRSA